MSKKRWKAYFSVFFFSSRNVKMIQCSYAAQKFFFFVPLIKIYDIYPYGLYSHCIDNIVLY